jgi:hypothetical protein
MLHSMTAKLNSVLRQLERTGVGRLAEGQCGNDDSCRRERWILIPKAPLEVCQGLLYLYQFAVCNSLPGLIRNQYCFCGIMKSQA